MVERKIQGFGGDDGMCGFCQLNKGKYSCHYTHGLIRCHKSQKEEIASNLKNIIEGSIKIGVPAGVGGCWVGRFLYKGKIG